MRIADVAFPVPLHRSFHYSVPADMSLAPGQRVRAPFGMRGSLTGTVLSVFEGEPQFVLKPIEATLDAAPVMPRELLETAAWMSSRYSAPIGECLKSVLPPYVRSLKRKAPAGLRAAPAQPPSIRPSASFSLTSGQEKALAALADRLRARIHAAVLLYGVPASGKTEVYLRLIRQAVADGGQAMFLLPEISLTKPFFDEFSAALDAPVVLWHSQLSHPERREAYFGLRDGRVRVVVGARSAALLPFRDLRLIVLDEEQDESFKQEEPAPHYHAREVALFRGAKARALVVLGSATPSLETWQGAQEGRTQVLRLSERVLSAEKPAVSVIAAPPPPRCVSEELLSGLKDRLARGEQAILLVNRRGFSTVVMCRRCGWVDRCPRCGVAKIQHEKVGGFHLRCHHCGADSVQPEACPECKDKGLRLLGTGTQKIVSELKTALPEARVLRMDRDTLDEKDNRVYERFRDREADVLVGTKLVAKSFHFPEVTLVGVVDADTMMHMPDFRSSERMAQLLCQVAGRSGRAHKPGQVLIQTLHPEHASVRAALADYDRFAAEELALRQSLGYPPYSALVRLVFAGAKDERVAEAAKEAAKSLESALPPPAYHWSGPAPAIPPMARGKFRHHLLLKVLDQAQLERALAAVRAVKLDLSTVKMKVQVDPYNLF